MLRHTDLPAPTAFGAPSRFSQWRNEQADAVLRILDSSKRFTAINAPTGIGKSMIAMMVQKMTGARVCVLTSTRALQDQYLRDWRAAGLFDVRGQQNHVCVGVRADGPLASYHRGAADVMVDRAPCHAGVWCPLKHRGGCGYYDDIRKGAIESLVLTNYDFWIAAGPSLGRFDYLIMDEADEADARVRSALRIELPHAHLRQWLSIDPLVHDASIAEWRDWAKAAHRKCSEAANEYADELLRDESIDTQSIHELKQLQALESTLGRIRALEGKWLIAPSRRGAITDFDPIWPTAYCESMLYRGIERIVLMSATLIDKDLKILGVPPAESEFFAYDSPFPIRNRPVYVVNFGANRVRVDSRLKDYSWLVGLIDSAIAQRLDRKILIHSVSYRLTQKIMSLSRYRHLMVTHDDADAKPQALVEFRRSTPGKAASILVSPSVNIGESFPLTECETVLIPKIPFKDMRDPIMKVREKEDADYGGHLMMKTLAQSVGRHVRVEGDRGEAIIFDDHAQWAITRYRRFAPKSFMRSIVRTNSIPPPLPKL